MSSLDGHIRRGFQRTYAYPRFISFLQYGNGTSAQFGYSGKRYFRTAKKAARPFVRINLIRHFSIFLHVIAPEGDIRRVARNQVLGLIQFLYWMTRPQIS